MSELGWGLVGAGDIAEKRVAPALGSSTRSRLMAVCRRRVEMAEAFARRFGAPHWHGAWRDLVNDADVDAVYVATPVNLHASIVIAAAEAGKHILCEKPMALSVSECDEMIAAADANGVQLGIAYYRHAYPIIRRVKDLLAAGVIGVPVVAQINSFEQFNPGPDHPRRWLLDPEQAGGGPMFDFGSHRIEVLVNVLGPVASVTAKRATVAYQRAVEDTATAIFSFETGATATLAVSHAAAEPQDTFHIFGSAGSIHIPKLNGPELHVVAGNNETTEHHPAPENLHKPLVQQFIDAVLDGDKPIVDGRAGREVNRILAAVYS